MGTDYGKATSTKELKETPTYKKATPFVKGAAFCTASEHVRLIFANYQTNY